MGLLSIFSSKGEISIRTHKPYYLSGETVTGEIKAEIKENIPCDGLFLEATGIECVKATTILKIIQPYQRGDEKWEEISYQTVKHEGSQEFFNEKIRIIDTKGVLLPGSYSFQFSYKLPEDLPGVFEGELKWSQSDSPGASHADSGAKEYEVSVAYKMKAVLQVDGTFSRNLRAKQKLVVHNGAPGIENVFTEKTDNIFLCCCFHRGSATIRVSLTQNSFISGQTADIKTEVENHSTRNISSIRVKLYRIVEITVPRSDNRGETLTRKYVQTAQKISYDGVLAGESKNMVLSFPIARTSQPSISSKFIKCEYILQVKCDVSMGNAIKVLLPTKIYAAPPENW